MASDLIYRQDAIDALCKAGCGSDRCVIACDDVKAIEALPSARQWIPCSESLPEEDHETGMGVQYSDYVLMTVFNEEDDETVIDYGLMRDGEWYSLNADIIIPNWWKVTAWMPLPEPYQEAIS